MLTDPDFPVSSWFLNTMSVAGLPADPAGGIPAQRQALDTRYREELAAALSSKRNEALAVSAATIVEHSAIYSQELPPDVKKKASEALVATFDKLPVQKQEEVFSYRWNALDPQTMLPLLRKVAQRYTDYADLHQMDAFWSIGASAAALKRWYELEPAEEVDVVEGEDDIGGYGDVGAWGAGYSASGVSIGGSLGHRVATAVNDVVPAGETQVRHGDHVHAVDGEIGEVQGFVVDPADHRVTHVLLREGHLWGRREVAIPVSAVVGMDDGIRLNLTKQQVADLPPVE